MFPGEESTAEGVQGGCATGEAEPLRGEKFIGDAGAGFARAVDEDRGE